jgi:hypothetical protein
MPAHTSSSALVASRFQAAAPHVHAAAAGCVVSGMSRTHLQRGEGVAALPDPIEDPNVQNPAGWAVNQATAELYDVDDPDVILERARELVREAQQREDERHDEYDDPDQGGEA